VYEGSCNRCVKIDYKFPTVWENIRKPQGWGVDSQCIIMYSAGFLNNTHTHDKYEPAGVEPRARVQGWQGFCVWNINFSMHQP